MFIKGYTTNTQIIFCNVCTDTYDSDSISINIINTSLIKVGNDFMYY